MRDTIDMAREAGLIKTVDCCGVPDKFCGQDEWKGNLKVFEALVRADERNRTWTQEHWTEYERSIAAAEREACAKVCDDKHDTWRWDDEADSASGPRDCAAAIRARGNT
jgi:hypothetical protein